MSIKNRRLLLIVILAVTCVVVSAISIGLLYNAAYDSTYAMLEDRVNTRSTLIEAVAKYDKMYSQGYPGGAYLATLKQIEQSYHNQKEHHYKREDKSVDEPDNLFHIDPTHKIEMVYGRMAGDSIEILLSHQNMSLGQSLFFAKDSKLAKPMRLALEGKSGCIEALDYRGKPVIAAYSFVEVLNIGMVAKIDLADFRAPYVKAGVIAAAASLLLIVLGSILFGRVTEPIIDQLEDQLNKLKTGQDALRESEAKYRTIIETIPQNIFMKDKNYRWVTINERFANSMGLKPEDVVGKYDIDFFPQELADKYRADDVRIIEQGVTEEFDEEYIEGGERRWVHTIKTPVRDDNDNIIGVLGVFWDVTEQKMYQMNLQILTDELSHKNRELEQIVYVTSHDLRSPLLNIQGFSKELRALLKDLKKITDNTDIADDLKQKITAITKVEIPDAVKFIETSSAKMDSLLSGLLKLSRLGRVALKTKRLNMNTLLADVTAAMEFRLKEVNTELFIDDLPECWGDETQINQVFSNLIDNAIKYRDPDRPLKINIEGRVESDYITYTVEDSGVGIDETHKEIIFDIFHRLDPGRSNGEGLGLTIVRRILQRHNGRITAESEPGKGSWFIIKLPKIG